MYNTKIILSVATVAGTSLAQTSTAGPNCQASLAAFADAPTPAPALSPYLGSAISSTPGQTALPDFALEDPDLYKRVICSVATEIPESLVPDFKSYGSGLLNYSSAHLSLYDAYITDCVTTGEEASTLINQIHSIILGTGGICETTPTTTPSSGAYMTGTGFLPIPTDTGSITLIPTAAAARPTGAFVRAAAVGGVLGAAAML
ncbi:hypothetical protein F4859DRAFT_516747 [Xylaria cf. heliscus]|nr:hypothetical protein F4859DRAFT_516747 [Xylaria cf. heliscus]